MAIWYWEFNVEKRYFHLQIMWQQLIQVNKWWGKEKEGKEENTEEEKEGENLRTKSSANVQD